MAVIQLDVWLHDQYVGTITNIYGDRNVFAFDEGYRSDPNAPVISFKAFRDPVTGEYRERVRPTRTRLHPYFSNLLPEGHLRRYLADHAHINAVRDFPLIWMLGQDLPGALIVTEHAGNATPPPDAAGRALGLRAQDEEPLRFSLAGVQLKFSANGDPKRGLTIPVQGMGGHWIVKMPDQRYKRVAENEFSMMTFAREVGIEVPDIGLIDPATIGGLPSDVRNLTGQAYYIRRFDRTASGGRIHTEDFAQANLIYPDNNNKYDQFNFDLLTEQVAQQTGVAGALDLIQRLVFMAGIGNGDMHSKNWSFIYRDGRTPVLSPAYDYESTIVYMPSDDLGMNLVGSKSFEDFDENRLTALARRAELPLRPTISAARDMAVRMREVWPKIASSLPMDSADREIITKHMDRVPFFKPSSGGTRAYRPAAMRRSKRSSTPEPTKSR